MKKNFLCAALLIFSSCLAAFYSGCSPENSRHLVPIHGSGSGSGNFSVEVYKLSRTVFSGQSYSVDFTFTNTSGSIASLSSAVISMGTAITWTKTADTCSNMSIGNNESCSIEGTFSMATANTTGTVSIKLPTKNNANFYTYSQDVKAVTRQTGYLAIRIQHPSDTTRKAYAAAAVGNKMITFNSNNMGTISAQNCDTAPSWNTYAVDLNANDTLYIPPYAGAGGIIYVSLDNKLKDGASPSVAGENNRDTYWQPFEYFFNSGSDTNINASNVNQVSIPMELALVCPADATNNIKEGLARKSTISDVPMSTIMTNIIDALSSWTDTWKTLVQYNSTNANKVMRICSAVNYISDNTKSDVLPFTTRANFDQYADDVWTYYKTHSLIIDASEIANLVTPGATCVLEGKVDSGTDKMNFTVYSGPGTCPADGTSKNPTGTDTQMTKFTIFDFLSGAAKGNDSSPNTTYGDNKTYRSVIGRAITAAQSIGFLPFCSDASFVYSKSNIRAQKAHYFTPQYTCLTHYSSYTDSVINQYSKQSSLYFSYYSYAYSDFLGYGGEMYDLDYTLYPMTVTVAEMK